MSAKAPIISGICCWCIQARRYSISVDDRGITCLQTVVSWTAEEGSFVHRVVTRRLQVTSSRVSALRGVECETSALLLAKRVMQEARVRDAASSPREAEKLQRAIGETAGWTPAYALLC